MAGNANSGNRSAYRGQRPKTYWTERKEREYQDYLRAQEAIREAARLKRVEASEEKARIRKRAYRQRIKAERRAAGLPPLKGGREKPGASTPRVRRFYERRRILLAAWEEALKEERRRNRRIAKGLNPNPLTSTERTRWSRERKESQRQAYLINQWWSAALDEKEAKAIIQERYPALDEAQVHVAYAGLVNQANGACLNVNRFTISENGVDGIEKANRKRAIFQALHFGKMGNTADYLAVLKEAEATDDLESLVAHGDVTDKTWMRNLVVKAINYGRSFIGNGTIILKAVAGRK